MAYKKITLKVKDEKFELRSRDMVQREADPLRKQPTINRNVVTREALKAALEKLPNWVLITVNYFTKGWGADTMSVTVHEKTDGTLRIGCKSFEPKLAKQIKKWANAKPARKGAK
jgi:hypothetical protein